MKETRSNMSEFYKYYEVLEDASSVEAVLDILITTTERLIPKTDMALVYLYDFNEKVLRLGAGTGVDESLGNIAFRPGESLTGKVFLTRRALACRSRQDVANMMSNISSENRRWYQEGTYRRTVKSSINVPLMDKDECLGTFTLNRYSINKPFSNADIRLLHVLTGQAARMIAYIRMTEALEDASIKSQFSKILIRGGGRRAILSLLEERLKVKFFLDTPEAETLQSIPILYNQTLLGHLTSSRPLPEFSRQQIKIINHAIEALSITLGRQLQSYGEALEHRSALFARKIGGEDGGALGKLLGMGEDEAVHCFALAGADFSDPAFVRRLENTADRFLPGAVLFIYENHCIILSETRGQLEDFAEYTYKNHGIFTGAGNIRPFRDLALSVREAVIAATNTAPSLAEYTNLGYERLWHHLDDEIKHNFINDHLGPLLDTAPDQLMTLGVLIDNGLIQKKRTAEQLYIHTNTLYQRIRRMEKILGVSFQDEHQWMNIVMAYKMYVALNIHPS